MARERNGKHLAAARARMYRELVFECAERLFAEEGFAAATIQDIAAEAGISLNTLYSAYPGKLEIYQHIHEARGGAFREVVRSAIEEAEGVLAKLEAAVHAYTRFLMDHHAYFAILARDGRSWGLAPKQAERRQRWRAGVEMTAPLIQQGMEQEIFYEGDAELGAASVQALMQSLLAGLVAKTRKPDARAIAEEIFRQVCRLLCRPESDAARGLRVA